MGWGGGGRWSESLFTWDTSPQWARARRPCCPGYVLWVCLCLPNFPFPTASLSGEPLVLQVLLTHLPANQTYPAGSCCLPGGSHTLAYLTDLNLTLSEDTCSSSQGFSGLERVRGFEFHTRQWETWTETLVQVNCWLCQPGGGGWGSCPS